jgi:hypothetical protein
MPDDRLLAFLAALTHPEVRFGDDQQRYVSVINHHLVRDGFRLEVLGQVSGYSVYQPVDIREGVQERVRTLIFAANGPKPEIVIDDVLTGRFRITRNQQYCLVYDQEIGPEGLFLTQLVEWWAAIHPQLATESVHRNLLERLRQSLSPSSPPEHMLWDTYHSYASPTLGHHTPALLPQVYLHYDPRTRRERGGNATLMRQRMDYLLLLPHTVRVVLEVDGVQHYADGDSPSPQLYAQMVAADRDLRLQGYEVYRFGGYELQGQVGQNVLTRFFQELFRKHGIG